MNPRVRLMVWYLGKSSPAAWLAVSHGDWLWGWKPMREGQVVVEEAPEGQTSPRRHCWLCTGSSRVHPDIGRNRKSIICKAKFRNFEVTMR